MGKEYTRLVTVLGYLPVAGNIIFHDNFEDLLKWSKYIGTGDSVFELDPSVAKQNGQSLYFKSRTTAAAENDFVGAYRDTNLLPSKIASFIGSFSYPSKTAVKAIYFLLQFYDCTNLHTVSFRYTPATPSWEYQDSTGAWQAISDLALTLSINTWHTVQFLANFDTDKYISLSVNDVKVDLSSIAFQSAANACDKTLRMVVYLSTAGAAASALNIDEIMLHEL